ncbi:MAG: NAD(P)-dependent oxidoreductase [Gammaproteobacteria bacterium]|nr:NAD(P)-dependent oxidoreductase [Gammaproteobacteria bacterium]
MGSHMAARLLAAGHAVVGFDVDSAATDRLVADGGRAAESPADAARAAEVLLVMVHDAAQVDRVLFGEGGAAGALDTLPPRGVVWLASTVPPAYAQALSARLASRGVSFIDGPVSGGTSGAEDGSLVAICGAAPDVLEAASFALAACAQHVHRVGPPGAGSTVKMINQLLVAAHSALTAEVMALALRADVDTAQLIEVIGQSAGGSTIFEKRAPRIAAGDHAVHVTIDTLRKDLSIAIESARQMGLDPTIALGVQGVLNAAADAGHGAASDTTLVDDYLGTRRS